MNEHDRSNLEFLLNASPEVIKDWHNQVSADDIEYAHELLSQYSQELRERSQALLLEAQLAQMDDYPDAARVIDKISRS
jgi:hypothetical protein